MSDTTILRQIALGVYPQREDEKPSWLERAGEKLFTTPIEWFSGSRLKLKIILPAIRREARLVTDLPESELIDQAIHLRFQLHQEGFERNLVAKTFALVREISRQKLGMAL